MFKTEWLRACVEGKTVDGREISAAQIQEMADSYDPSVYRAEIWLEHMRGLLPDSMFKSLGFVAEVKAESIKAGVLAGKLALYVKLVPGVDLINMVRNGQKVHLSVEIMPFMDAVQSAYLLGVGVTDSPASIGTEVMQFSLGKRPQNLFSSLYPCELGACVNPSDFNGKAASMESFRGVSAPITGVAIEQFNDLAKQVVELKKQVSQFAETAKNIEIFLAQPVTPNRPEQGSTNSTNVWDWA